MTEVQKINGQCLCGAVTVSAEMPEPALRACRCEMCRRHTSSMFMSLNVDQSTVQVTGPIKIYRSSEWAQRAFCENCGTIIHYGTIDDGVRNLAAGLFENAGGAPLRLEFFADADPKTYTLSGDHTKMSTQETIAMFAPNEDDA